MNKKDNNTEKTIIQSLNQSQFENLKSLSSEDKQKIIKFLQSDSSQEDIGKLLNDNLASSAITAMLEVVRTLQETHSVQDKNIINNLSDFKQISLNLNEVLKSIEDDTTKVEVIKLFLEAKKSYNSILRQMKTEGVVRELTLFSSFVAGILLILNALGLGNNE